MADLGSSTRSLDSNIRVREVIETVSYAADIRQTAVEMEQSVAQLFGEPGRLRLLQTPVNTAPLLIHKELQSVSHCKLLKADCQKQAGLAAVQAATLHGAIALLCGEVAAPPFGEVTLTLGWPARVCFPKSASRLILQTCSLTLAPVRASGGQLDSSECSSRVRL